MMHVSKYATKLNPACQGVASPEDIDRGIKLGLSHAMGPLQLADFIGADHDAICCCWRWKAGLIAWMAKQGFFPAWTSVSMHHSSGLCHGVWSPAGLDTCLSVIRTLHQVRPACMPHPGLDHWHDLTHGLQALQSSQGLAS